MDSVSGAFILTGYEELRRDIRSHCIVSAIAQGVLGTLAITFSSMEYFGPLMATVPSISMLLCSGIGVYSVITSIYFAVQAYRMGRRYSKIAADASESIAS